MSPDSKPRIDFYKLNGQDSTGVNRFCCQLAEKVVKMGHSVFIRTQDEQDARVLDDMLWTYSDSSFLPHARLDDGTDQGVSVIIGHRASPKPGYLLINLGEAPPDDLHNYERVAEIINDTPDRLRNGRIRYAGYKKQAYSLHYHEITA